jgi:hypothetical protein
VLLVQQVKTSVFRNVVQLSVGFDTLVDVDPDVPAAANLQELAQRTWQHEAPAAPTSMAAAAPTTQAGMGLTVVTMPLPATLADAARAADRMALGTELLGSGVFTLCQLDLDTADLDHLVVQTWSAFFARFFCSARWASHVPCV